eukprot:1191060-Amorphochlora_amoeboformis.AAC.1
MYILLQPKPRPQDRPKGKENNYGLSSLSSFDSGTKQNPRASSPKLNGKRERAENDRPSQRQRLGKRQASNEIEDVDMHICN